MTEWGKGDNAPPVSVVKFFPEDLFASPPVSYLADHRGSRGRAGRE